MSNIVGSVKKITERQCEQATLILISKLNVGKVFHLLTTL